MVGAGNPATGVAGRQQPDIVIPRLDLDLSMDHSEFVELNELYSEGQSKGVRVMEHKKTSLSMLKKQRNKYIVDSQDLVTLLANQGVKKKKRDGDLLEFNGDICSLKKSDGRIIEEVDASDSPSLRILQHLYSLRELGITKSGPKAGYVQKDVEFYCFSQRKWWKNKNRLTKKDLLLVSIAEMDTYRSIVHQKNAEAHQLMSKIAANNEVINGLQLQIRDMEESNESILQDYENEKQQRREESDDMKRAISVLRKEKDDMTIQASEMLERFKMEEMNRRNKQMEQLGKLKGCLDEKTNLILKMNRQLTDQSLKLQDIEQTSKCRIAELEEELKQRNAENEKLKSKISSVLGINNASVENMQEVFNASKMEQPGEFYDLNMAKEVQISAVMLERDKIKDDLMQAKKMIENLKASQDKENSKHASSSGKNHEHLIDSMCCDGPKLDFMEKREKGSRDYAVLKLDDLWAEQMACHQSNLDKLKEMQNLRLELIKNRQQLEKSMHENTLLKESIQSKEDLKEIRFKTILSEKNSQLKATNEEVEKLREALYEQSNKAADLSKQLSESLAIQRAKNDEIQILNAAVKKEDNSEYSVVTTESMCNFKKHVKSLKDENRILSNECDRVENLLNDAEKEVHALRKNCNALHESNEMLKDRCRELESDSEVTETSMKQLKEKLRSLTKQNNSMLEDLKDKTYELVNVQAKLEKAQERLTDVDSQNQVLEEVNCTTSRKYTALSRQLREAEEELNDLKFRYANVEKTYKEHEAQIGDLSLKVNMKEKAIIKLERAVKDKEHSLAEFKDRNNESIRDKDAEIAQIKKELDKCNGEAEDLKLKIEEAQKIAETREVDFRFKTESYLKENKSLLAEVKLLDKELKNLKSSAAQKEKEYPNLQNELQRCNDDFEKENEKLKAKVRGLEDELVSLKSTNESMKNDLGASLQQGMLQKKFELLQEENEALNAELGKMQIINNNLIANDKNSSQAGGKIFDMEMLERKIELLLEEKESLIAELAQWKKRSSNDITEKTNEVKDNRNQRREGNLARESNAEERNYDNSSKGMNIQRVKQDKGDRLSDDSGKSSSYTPSFSSQSNARNDNKPNKPIWLFDSSNDTKKNDNSKQQGSKQVDNDSLDLFGLESKKRGSSLSGNLRNQTGRQNGTPNGRRGLSTQKTSFGDTMQQGSNQADNDTLDLFGLENKRRGNTALTDNAADQNGRQNSTANGRRKTAQRVTFVDENLRKNKLSMMDEEEDSLNSFCLEKTSRRGRSRGLRSDEDAAEELKRLVGY